MSQIVTIQTGDSLTTLAHKYFGDESKWRFLSEQLKRSVFDPLVAGEKIQIPDKAELLNYAENAAKSLIQTELKKRYPDLDLSSISGIDEIKIIDWIL